MKIEYFNERQFKALNISIITKVVKSKKYWEWQLIIASSIFPLIQLLRVCDKWLPSMDKLYYAVRQTDKRIRMCIPKLNRVQDEMNNTTVSWSSKITSTDDDIDDEESMDSTSGDSSSSADADDDDDESDDELGDVRTNINDGANEIGDYDERDASKQGMGYIVQKEWKKV